MTKHKFNIITYKSGAEGPKHDPYHYEELSIYGRNGITTVHLGLAYWVSSNGVRITDGEHNIQLNTVFRQLTGIEIDVAMRLYRTLPYRKHSKKCGGRTFNNVSGYPGETLYICGKCQEIVDSHFNRSAVE